MASPVRFAKDRRSVEAAGYTLVRIHSSHPIFERPGRPIVSIPVHHNLVKPFYVQQVERIVAADKEARGKQASGQLTADKQQRPKGKRK